jgi:DNA-binding MarR family transcriptional regulator
VTGQRRGELVKDLGLDPGYLSRIIRSFELKKMVSRTGSKTDARQQLLSLTAKGRLAFNKLEARTNEENRRNARPAHFHRATANGSIHGSD